MSKSTLETLFDEALAVHGADLPKPAEEFLFAREAMGRRWRFDYAWPQHKIAVEIEGVFGAKSRHRTAVGYHNDCEKYNAACELGWRVLRFTSKHIKNDVEACVETVRRLLIVPPESLK